MKTTMPSCVSPIKLSPMPSGKATSDIHVEPYGEKRETLVRFRVDGDCFEYMKIPPSYRRAIVSRLKIMASLDIAERRKPQDGKIKFKIGRRIRKSNCVSRRFQLPDITKTWSCASSPPASLCLSTKWDFPTGICREIKSIAAKPYGIILCVGPTGSGKTTTLHSVLGSHQHPRH